MNTIQKTTPPESFVQWVNDHPGADWNDFSGKEAPKDEFRAHLLEEQGHVCCFCGTGLGKIDPESKKITQGPVVAGEEHNIVLSHMKPRSKRRDLTFDYKNICASCDSTRNPPTLGGGGCQLFVILLGQ